MYILENNNFKIKHFHVRDDNNFQMNGLNSVPKNIDIVRFKVHERKNK